MMCDEAINIAQGLLVRKVFVPYPGMVDEDDARQDLTLYVLERINQYDPERAPLPHFVRALYGVWWKSYASREVWRKETFVPQEEAGEDRYGDGLTEHQISERAHELLEMLPAGHREVVMLHLGYKVPLSAVEELTGIKRATVHWRSQRAIKVWRAALAA